MNTTSTLGFLAAFAIMMPTVGCAGEASGVALETGATGGVAGAAGVASGGEANNDAGNGGAGGSPNVDAGNGDAGGSPTCYPATGTAPECRALELCSSAVPAIHADASNCQPGQCTWTLQPNAGDTLTYENDQGWFFLRFTNLSVSGSTADFRATFEHTNFYAKFPVRGGSSSQEATYFESRTSPDDFDVFEVVDGRFHARVSFTISHPYTFVFSATAICGDTNHCVCMFAAPSADTVFDVDLPIATP